MITGVQCKIDSLCRHLAPVETRISSEHRKLIRLAAMRQSPKLADRLIGYVLAHFAERDIEAGE